MAAPAVTLTATPTTGTSPLSVTLAWSSTGAVSCAAPWTTSVATTGTATVSVTATTTYSIICSDANGSALVSWIAPTQNTDNTPLINLAGFEIFHSTSVAGLLTATPIILNDKLLTTYTITGLPAGSRYYAMKAFDTNGVRSDMTNSVTNVVTIPAGSATATVTVTTKPKPPVIVTVSVVVYNVIKKIDGFVLLPVGTIPLDTECNPNQTINGYNVVPRSKVTWSGSVRPDVVVALCSAA